MATHRLIALIMASAFFLAGCGGRDLAAENQRLRNQIATEQAKIDYAVWAASVTAGCDFIVPLCPASITDAGQSAIEAGYSGGGWMFWLIAAIKLTVLGLFVGAGAAAARYVGQWWWWRFNRPTEEKIKEARRLIKMAEHLREIQGFVERENLELERVRLLLSSEQERLAAIQRELDSLEAVKKALNGFNSSC